MIFYNNLKYFDKTGNELNAQLIEDLSVTLSVEAADQLAFNAVLAPVVDETGVLQYIDIIHGGNGFSDLIDITIHVYDNVNEVEILLEESNGDINVGITDGALKSITILNPPSGLPFPSLQSTAFIPMGIISTNLIESEEIRILEEVAIYNTTTTETTIGWVYPRGGASDTLNLSWDDTEFSDEDEFNLFSINKDEEYGWIEKNTTQSFDFADGTGDISVNIDGKNYRRVVSNDVDTNVMHINIMFSSKEVGVFERALAVNINQGGIDAQLSAFTFMGETEEVDERFGNLLQNFARDFPNEKEFLLRDSDIFEALTDNTLLNQKKKELLVEGDNIYPYVGSYKALINFLNWAGYDDLKIKEYWLNLDETSENYKKFKHQEIPFDIFQEGGKPTRETLPSKKFKKTNLFGLYYNINQITDDVDQYGIPITEDAFMFSIEEVLIKLFGLKQYLKHNFLPLNARIIDITGEGIYFERYSLNAWQNGTAITNVDAVRETNFTVQPEHPYIIDLRPLGDFDYGLPTDINTTTEDVVTGVKCIAANNEYLSSPVGNYLPASSDDLDIEIQYSNYTTSGSTNFLMFLGGSLFGNPQMSVRISDTFIGFWIRENSSAARSIQYNTTPNTNGNIKVIGTTGVITLYVDDVAVGTLNETVDTSLFDGQGLKFLYNSTYGNVTYNYVKINSHEWTASNWTAPTTTNSQGVVTTLHSDISTADMILSSPASPTWNSIANTVLGYYDNINNVEKFADAPDAPIGAPVVLSMTLFDIVWNDLNASPWNDFGAEGGSLSATMDFGGGILTSIEIDNAGAGYLADPVIEIQGGLDVGGVAATAHVELSGGKIVNVVVDTPGSGYISQPEVVLTGGFPNTLINTWDTLGVGEFYEIEWRVTGDDGVFKYAKRGRIDAFYQHTIILPYIGTYTVEMILYDTENNIYNLFKKSAITVHSYEAEYCAYSAGGAYIQKWNDQDFTWNEAEQFGYTWFVPIITSGTLDDIQISWDELEKVNNHGKNSIYPDTVDTKLLDVSERDIIAGYITEATLGEFTDPDEYALNFDAANSDYVAFPQGSELIQNAYDFEINFTVSGVTSSSDGVVIAKGLGSSDGGWSIVFDNASQKLVFSSDMLAGSADAFVDYAEIPFGDPELNVIIKRKDDNFRIYINTVLKFDVNTATTVLPTPDPIPIQLPLLIGAYSTDYTLPPGQPTKFFTGRIHNIKVDKVVININEGSGYNVYANLRAGTIYTSNVGGYSYIETMWSTTPGASYNGLLLEVDFPLFEPPLLQGDFVYFRKGDNILRTQLLRDSIIRDDLTTASIMVEKVAIEIDDSWQFLSSIGSTIVTSTYDPTLVNFKPGDFITFKKPSSAFTIDKLLIDSPSYGLLQNTPLSTSQTPLILTGLNLTGDYTQNFKPGERCGIYQFNSFDSTEFVVNNDEVLPGIQCIAANNEYLSSPVGNYFGDTLDGIDLRFKYVSDNPSFLVLASQLDSTFSDNIFIYDDNVAIYFDAVINGGAVNQFVAPYSGIGVGEERDLIIKVIGTTLTITLNGVLIGSETITPMSLISMQSGVLAFNSLDTTGDYEDVTYNYIKINDHEWNFTEGTGSTTTNSQGVVTTLNSTVSTEAMWVSPKPANSLTITSVDSILDQFIPGFTTIDLYRQNGLTLEYKQILLVTDVQESGTGPYTTTIIVQEIDGDLSFYTAYAESYLTYKYNAFQTELINSSYDGVYTNVIMNINEYPVTSQFASQFYDPAETFETNWYFDYSISDGEYSIEIESIGTEGGYPYMKLNDVDSELYMTSTGFIIDNNIFNVDRANKHIGDSVTWDRLEDLKWDEAFNLTWDGMIFNKAVTPGFKIMDVGIGGTIQFNEDPLFEFQTIDGGMATVIDRLNAAVVELNQTAENGLSGFHYLISNDNTHIQAIAKNMSPNNLGILEFGNGVIGEWVADTSLSHTYPINNYLNESWQDGFFGSNNSDPKWNYLYSIYNEYGVDPVGERGWYPAENIPAKYATEGYDWYSSGVPYHKPIGGSLTWTDLNISKAELYVNNFSTVFINANRSTIPGKIAYNIELYNEAGELLVKSTSPLLIWLFTEKGKYDIKVTVWDNRLNQITSTRENAIIVN